MSGNNKGKTSSNEVVLKKELGLPSSIAIAIGNVIGAGIFVMPKGAARGGGSVGVTLIMWTVCGIFSGMGALSYAELATMIPKSGGQYQYLKVAFGQWLGFLQAWMTIVLRKPAGQALMSLTFADYILSLYYNDGCGPAPIITRKLTAISLIVFIVAVNCYTVKLVARLHIVASFCKCCALVMIGIGGIVKLCQGYTDTLSTGFENSNTDPSAIGFGLFSCLFAYDGWNALFIMAEELKRPSRDMPVAMVIVMSVITTLYVLANISYFTVMNIEELLASPAVGVTWGERVMPGVSWIIPACVAISIFGSINVGVMAGSRLQFAIARDGVWPRFLAMINVKTYSPVPSVIFTGSMCILYTIVGDITGLTTYLAVATLMFHFLTVGALLFLRVSKKMKDATRPYKVPILFPILFGLFCLSSIILSVVKNPKIEMLYAVLIVLSGLFIYGFFITWKKKIPGSDWFICGLQLLLQVSPQTSMEQGE